LPVRLPEVAVRVFWPAPVPSVHEPTVAMPFAPVVALVPVAEPPPEATANVTATPATGLPYASVTSTDGFVATLVFTVALWWSPAFTAIELAAAEVTVRPVLVAPETPLALAVSVYVFAASTKRSLNVAMPPDALSVVVPPSGEPGERASVTAALLEVTRLPFASRTSTLTGESVVPAVTVACGSARNASCEAAPGVNVTGALFDTLAPSSFAVTVTPCATVDEVSVAV